VNLILVFLFFVVSTPFEFLFSSCLVVGELTGMFVILTGVILGIEKIGLGVVFPLVVVCRGVVDVVVAGLLEMSGCTTLGFCVVNNWLVSVVCVRIPDLGLLKLLGMIWFKVVGLILFTSCLNKGGAAPLFWGTILAFNRVFLNWTAKFFISFANWFKDWSSRRFAF
jgi:hypothetical protein